MQIEERTQNVFKVLSLAAMLLLASCTFDGKVTELSMPSAGSGNLLEGNKINLNDLSVAEGSTLSVAFILEKKVSSSVTLTWSIVGAGASNDFVQVSGQTTILANSQSGSFSIIAKDNLVYDENRLYSLQIESSTASGSSSFETSSAQLTLVDNESIPTIRFTNLTQSITEGSSASIQVQLDQASSETITINYASSSGTALSGSDFTSLSGTLTFLSGETTKSLSVVSVEDSADESNENFQLTLSAPTSAILSVTHASITITINDNDLAPAAQSLSWSQSSPYLGTTANATWITSTSSTRSSQQIQFYSDAVCGTTSGGLVTLPSISTNTYSFSVSANNSYSYTIIDTDSDGNLTTSACSGSLTVGAPPSGLSYSVSSALYLYNDGDSAYTANISSLSPSVTGTVTSYSISPNLLTNTGLSFDTSTGIISGKPSITSATTTYTITATNGVGSTSTTISIRTAPGFDVDSNADLDDANPGSSQCLTSASTCTLRAAISKINSMSAVARVIRIPAMTITLTANLPNFSRSTEVIGASMAGTVIDGAGAYYIFRYGGNNLSFSMSYMTLQNAVSAHAPILYDNGVNGGSFAIDNVHARSSYATTQVDSTKGGAINISKTGSITNSIFESLGHTSYSDRGLFVCGPTTIDRSLFLNSYEVLVSRCTQNLTITNSTFEGNVRGFRGIEGTAAAQFTNCTFYNNGTGIFGYSIITNSIMHTSWCNGVGSGGGNQIYSSGGCGGTGADFSGDPLLGSLQNNGGSTMTRAISSSSPARDSAIAGSCTVVDQRGVVRVSSTCDIGAYEY